MGSGPCVYEISSSSDDDEDGILLVKASEPRGSYKRNKHISNLDEDIDVVVIEKLHCPEARTMGKSYGSSILSGTGKVPGRKTSDDDCCILDHNPEKNLHALDSKSNDAEDLVMTGESGPVACRDYPHARHLCAKFPFESTDHQSCCPQCHCYVCDILAPCLFWSKGKDSSDHCHAYDKDEKWNVLRNCGKPSSLPLPAAVPQPRSSRNARPRSHSVSHSQQSLPGVVIPSSGISSSACNIFPDPNVLFGISPNFLYTSETSSVPFCLGPYAPPAANSTRGIGTYSDSMVFSTIVPAIVDSSSSRTRYLNHGVPANRSKSIRQRNSNFTNQTKWATAASYGEVQDLNLPVSTLPHTAGKRGLISAASPQSRSRDVSLEKNAQIHSNRAGNSREQMRLISRGHTRMSELAPTVSRDSNDRWGQLSHRGSWQSNMLKDFPFGQRTIGDILQDGYFVGEPCQWEHENGIQTSESIAVVPSQFEASQTACNDNLHGHVQSGAETQRKGSTGQNVQMRSVISIPEAGQVQNDKSQEEIVTQQFPIGQDIDGSPTLDDILAQLDCSEMWADLDLIGY